MNSKWYYLLILVIIFLGVAYLFRVTDSRNATFPSPSPVVLVSPGNTPEATISAILGVQTKHVGCVAVGSLPDPSCTPGAIFEQANVEQICQKGYASSVRNVTVATKNRVYLEYGVQTRSPGEYEIDHLISLELGGSNEIANLWPESAEPRPGFHEKDVVENYLHDQVCSGQMSLTRAQQLISKNWLTVYQQIQTSR